MGAVGLVWACATQRGVSPDSSAVGKGYELFSRAEELFEAEAYEEALMTEHDYPGIEAHTVEHQRLLQHIEDLARRYKNGDLLLSFAVVIELKGWASIHIEKSDRPLGEFLKDKEG